MVSNLGLALLRNRELRGSTVVRTRQCDHSNFRFRHESSITAMYPPFYRLLEFCNLLIRGLLPEVLIAEPCINFTRCREGFSAGEGSEVEQTAREVAVLSRVLWCEFTWLICLVALGVILRLSFCGFFWIRGPQDAGAYVGRWERLGFSLAGLRLTKGPVDFANASLGRFNAARSTT